MKEGLRSRKTPTIKPSVLQKSTKTRACARVCVCVFHKCMGYSCKAYSHGVWASPPHELLVVGWCYTNQERS